MTYIDVTRQTETDLDNVADHTINGNCIVNGANPLSLSDVCVGKMFFKFYDREFKRVTSGSEGRQTKIQDTV